MKLWAWIFGCGSSIRSVLRVDGIWRGCDFFMQSIMYPYTRCDYFNFNAFKLFSNLTDLIGDDRLICTGTFRSLCCDSNFALSAVFPTILRKYLHSARCVESIVVDDGGHSPPLAISLLTLARTIWATRPSVGVVWIHLLDTGIFCCTELLSNKFFLPITVVERLRFGDFVADDKDDDDDDVETFDAVDNRCDVESSSSLRLL